ncbi:hypothetical protein CsSME_00021845 [Camellia sinensis var. sinensis]
MRRIYGRNMGSTLKYPIHRIRSMLAYHLNKMILFSVTKCSLDSSSTSTDWSPDPLFLL